MVKRLRRLSGNDNVCGILSRFFRKYIPLENGIPSHDTIGRVMGMISPEIIQQLYMKWQECLDRNDGELLKKIICIDGKTMCGNKRNEEKPAHIVTAWSKEDGFSLGQKAVSEKSNEITAIPELLDKIQIKGQVVRSTGKKRVLSDRRHQMVRVERAKKHYHGEKNH